MEETEGKIDLNNEFNEENGDGDDILLNSHSSISRAESEGEVDGELSRLMNENGFASDGEQEVTETPASVPYVSTKKEEQEIFKIIETAKTEWSTAIDLSNKRLQSFPDEILELGQIEFMYLEGNDIGFLPDEFFKHFPRLTWLDLRNNLLSRIPSIYLSNHTCLRNLLLEGNNLRNLPLELGLVKSLHGLNLAGNPLEFPPQEIVQHGTHGILAFLREMMDAKNSAKMADLELTLSEEAPDGFEHISASSDDWNTTASMMELARRRETAQKSRSAENGGDHNHSRIREADEYTLGARSAELHRPALYSENKYQHIQKLKKAGAFGAVEKRLPSTISYPCFCNNQTPNFSYGCLRIQKAPLNRRISVMWL